MIIIAFINNLGEIQNIVSPGADSDYIDGQEYGNLIAKHLPVDTDWGTAIETYIFKDGAWTTRPRRPSEFHYWSADGWVKNTPNLLDSIISARNSKLFASDWTQLPDSPLSESKKEEWRVYRQTLRDFPDTLDLNSINSLSDVVWPTPPA